MSEDPSQGASEIESLLGERQRLQEWLARLADAKDAPARVKDRVRADYEGRLAEVVARLRGFSANLTASLNEVRARLRELEAQKVEVEEEQAEAQLRHAVGEFADQEWERIEGEARGKLQELGGQIAGFSGEIARLEEVLGQIVPPPPARRSPGTATDAEPLEVQVLEPESVNLELKPNEDAEPLAVPPPDQVSELGTEPRKPPEAPRFTPRTATETGPRERGGRLIRFPPQRETPSSVDELTFLKSVAIESPEGDDALAKGRSGGAGKTLKCTDCGAMNRPTEWYCERCGAELAAL